MWFYIITKQDSHTKAILRGANRKKNLQENPNEMINCSFSCAEFCCGHTPDDTIAAN